MRSLVLIASLFISASSFAEIIHSQHTEVRANIPGQKNTAAFAHWHNTSDQTLRLTSLSTDAAERIELHTHVDNNGQMQMRKVEDFSLAPKQHLSMRDSNLHLMLMNTAKPLKEGEKINIKACFNGDQCVESSYTVISIHNEKKAADTKHQHKQHNHHH